MQDHVRAAFLAGDLLGGQLPVFVSIYLYPPCNDVPQSFSPESAS